MVTGWWAISNVLSFSLTADKEIPPKSKAESERKTDWPQVRQYAEWRERHDFEWSQAKRSPVHLGHYLGYGHVMGELPEGEFVSLEEHKAQELEAAKGIQDRLISMLERYAEAGVKFTPES